MGGVKKVPVGNQSWEEVIGGRPAGKRAAPVTQNDVYIITSAFIHRFIHRSKFVLIRRRYNGWKIRISEHITMAKQMR